MFARLLPSALVALLATHSLLCLPGLAQVQVNEGTQVAVPIDFELTSDGSRAVVRAVDPTFPATSNSDVITVWETSGGTQIAGSSSLGFCSGASPASPSLYPSDAVRVVGSKAVLIANFIPIGGLWQTLIDVVDAGAATPACLANFVLPSSPPPSGPSDEAGEAHDLDITPDGKYAVVACRNWVFVVDLSATPSPTVVLAKNTGSSLIRPSWALPPVDVVAAVDSVAVTNERAIVVQGAFHSQVGFYPIIQLIDLTGTTPVATQIDMEPIIKAWNPPNGPNNSDFDPHDVAITPRGAVDVLDELAVVTYDYAVSVFDLASMTHVNTFVDDTFHRRYGKQVDSVEVTWDRAVVTGGLSTVPLTWSAMVFSLRTPTVPPVPALTLVKSFEDSGFMPHDLAIHRDADAAVIKSGAQIGGANDVLSGISSATPVWTSLPSQASPYRDWVGFPSGAPRSRISDSALTATVSVGGVTKYYGVTIGGTQALPFSGAIDVVDLRASPPAPVITLTHDANGLSIMPTDLDFSSVKRRVFVRCEAPPDESWPPPVPPPTTGRDILVVDLGAATPALIVGTNSTYIGGSGVIRSQVDSLIINRLRAVSVSEFGTSPGHVHTATNP